RSCCGVVVDHHHLVHDFGGHEVLNRLINRVLLVVRRKHYGNDLAAPHGLILANGCGQRSAILSTTIARDQSMGVRRRHRGRGRPPPRPPQPRPASPPVAATQPPSSPAPAPGPR